MTQDRAKVIERAYFKLPKHKYFKIGFLNALSAMNIHYVHFSEVDALRIYNDDGSDFDQHYDNTKGN